VNGERSEQLQKLLGAPTGLPDRSYDTLEGARRAAALGRPLGACGQLDLAETWSNSL